MTRVRLDRCQQDRRQTRFKFNREFNWGLPLTQRGKRGRGGDSALLRITGIIVPIILDYALQVCMSQTEKNKQETSELFCTENIFTFANSSLQLRSRLLSN